MVQYNIWYKVCELMYFDSLAYLQEIKALLNTKWQAQLTPIVDAIPLND
jgi:hypothetical protein